MNLISREDVDRYKNIEWLMVYIDVEDVLDRLGIEHSSEHRGEIMGFCPDHEDYTGNLPSHPKWSVNTDTGKTYCFTEGRGSNLVFVVSRVLNCVPDDAVKFMTGSDVLNLRASGLKGRISKLRRKGKVKKQKDEDENNGEVWGLDKIQKDLINRPVSDDLYLFFEHPPGKAPTNISKETVDNFGIFERRWGYYSNRAVIPFHMNEELVGFCAIDMLGEKEWLKSHPLKNSGDYRKVLYPQNFKSGEYLFNYDNCTHGCDSLIITEGAREVLKLYQEGFENSLAVLGSGLGSSDPLEVGQSQLRLLAKLAPREVILMFDGDKAGYKATEKLEESLSRLFPVRPCLLDEGVDPKQLSHDEIKKIIKSSKLTSKKF
jgi:5S rRNA maturation endonuclease (ribonuclease M5)